MLNWPNTPEVSATEGAALPTAAGTALQALKAAGVNLSRESTLSTPSIILITAASGGVGHCAVQLAKLAGLHVTATCGARNVGLVRGLGADEVLDYRSPEGATLRSPSGRKYDMVVHCATGIKWSVFEPNLSENGVVVDITPTMGAMATSLLKKLTLSKKRLVPFMLNPRKDEMELLVERAKQRKVTTVVDSRVPLGKAEDAWGRSMEGHATVKIIVEM